MAVHRLLANNTNAVRDAAIVASSTLPASRRTFRLPGDQAGSARAILAGGYTGADDTALDIEIVTADGSGMLSAPVFAGAGNGAISELSAAVVPTQTFTLLLASTGTPTKRAAVDFYGVKLVAKPSGAAGNGVEIAVSTAGIAAAPTAYSFLEEAKAGTSEFKGPQWDFGGYQLTADGEIDPRTPRLRFGSDPQVYRQYKTFKDNDWAYVIDPPIVRDLPAETQVFALSGGYTVTVTAGATIEPHPGIVTLFDLLNAIKTRSNLVEVVGVVVEDKTPGGMAAEDLPLRTDAYALPAAYAGNAKFPGLGAVAVAPSAPTEIVTLECVDVVTLGGETWSVKGSVSGALADCETGRPYRAGSYGFTVPRVVPPSTDAPTGRIKVTDISLVTRPEGAQDVELCVKPIVAGAKAKAKTVEVVYAKKPAVKDCKCENAQVAGRLDFRCLGVSVEEGATVGIVAAYQARLENLYAFRQQFILGNTGIAGGALRTVIEDVDLANRVTDLFARCLDEMFVTSDPPASALTEWEAALTDMASDLAALGNIQAPPATPRFEFSAFYEDGEIVLPPVGQDTGHTYKVILGFMDVSPLKTGPGPYPPDYQKATNFRADTAAGIGAWPIDGTAVAVSGYGQYPVAFTQTTAPVKAMLADQGPYAGTDATAGAGTATLGHTVEQFVQRYAARMDFIRTKAGIVPKSDAGRRGSACWRECDGDYEWQVGGREYLPACTNVPYHSCVEKIDQNGREYIESTQEFGFVIRCACPDRLLPGDKFSLAIDNDAGPAKAYAVGDLIKIPVIAAAPLELAGGQDGDDTLTWTVRSSAGGAWPDYMAPIGSEPLYSNGGLQFRIKQGGIPFALGDQFMFSMVGGTFKWRRDGGDWSAPAAIGTAPAPLADGLTLAFRPGPAPAFVAGDLHRFTVRQPNSPGHVASPHGEAWRWSGSEAVLTATWPSDRMVSALGLLRHSLAASASVALTLADADGNPIYTWTPTIRPGPLVVVLPAALSARALTVTLAGATGQALGWIYAGVPLETENNHLRCTLRAAYSLQPGPAIGSRSLYLGEGRGGEMEWDLLSQADFDALLALVGGCKRDGDAPMVVVPNIKFPESAMLVRVDTDAIDFKDWWEFQADDWKRRCIAATLPLAAVMQ